MGFTAPYSLATKRGTLGRGELATQEFIALGF
jgi:hypothetical protein